MLVTARGDDEAGILGAKYQWVVPQDIIAAAEDYLRVGVRRVAVKFACSVDCGGKSGHRSVESGARRVFAGGMIVAVRRDVDINGA